jgi:hypothetical protein
LFYFYLILNTFFSVSPFISFFWSINKAHSFLMINNLFLIYIIFLNLDKNFIKKIINFLIWSWFFISIISIKEYFFPSYKYWDLSNRAIWTFGHPNYLALFLLLIIPLLYKKIFFDKKYIFLFFLFFIIFSLLLTKSALAIFIFFIYNIYFFIKFFLKIKVNKFFIFILFLLIILVSFFITYKIYPEKLTSFISRFFIWKTSFKIIFSDLKIFLIWNWIETFYYFFDKYKDINLYIFENIWFSADRPHNIFLYFLYHFWLIGLSFFLYFLYHIQKNIKYNFYFESIIIFLIFCFFNFSTITSYLLIIFFLSQIFNKNKFTKKIYFKNFFIVNKFFLIIAIIFSLISVFFSYKFYLSETKNIKNKTKIFLYNPKNFYEIWNYKKGLEIEKIKSKNYFLSKIISQWNLKKNCLELVNNYSIAENYFLCGNYFFQIWDKKNSNYFYNLWLKKIPDLWNKNSIYYKNKFLKFFIQKQRFLNKKYSNLKEILERVK